MFLYHRSGGGEYGNDGWVEADSLFYQLYAPPVQGTKSDIHKKYKSNLDRLLNAIVNEGKYKGSISKYVFIVNTMDEGLPVDADDFIGKTTQALCKKYAITVDCGIHNLDYVKDLLETVDDEKLLHGIVHDIKSIFLRDPGKFELQTSDILEFLEKMLEKISETNNFISENYEWIPLASKIEINDLQGIGDNINIISSKLNIVENAKKLLDDPMPRIGIIIVHYVKVYQDAISKGMSKINIYSHIIKDIMGLVGREYETHIEYVLVYILNKCEIFERS